VQRGLAIEAESGPEHGERDAAPYILARGPSPMSSAFELRSEIASLLTAAEGGEANAVQRLVPLLYDELCELARRQLARERPGHTLQTTALVHEAYLKLADDSGVARRGRAYFFAAAARAMRQVLVDHARKRSAEKRGGSAEVVTLEDDAAGTEAFAADLLDLDDALRALAEANQRHARVVECRFFGGMSVEDTAAALGVSPRTVKNDWALARAWLYDALRGASED
jgi:RNA polymerase sigma-70 factor, ECF subfamily